MYQKHLSEVTQVWDQLCDVIETLCQSFEEKEMTACQFQTPLCGDEGTTPIFFVMFLIFYLMLKCMIHRVFFMLYECNVEIKMCYWVSWTKMKVMNLFLMMMMHGWSNKTNFLGVCVVCVSVHQDFIHIRITSLRVQAAKCLGYRILFFPLDSSQMQAIKREPCLCDPKATSTSLVSFNRTESCPTSFYQIFY